MDRNDWIFVGTRLFGLYLLVDALLRLPAVLMAASLPGAEGFAIPLVSQGARALAGVLLLFGAPGILRWLSMKDARLVPGRPVPSDRV